MSMEKKQQQELDNFLEQWPETPEKNKAVFEHFKNYLSGKEGVTLDFLSRPGVTYSLRATHFNQKDKDLFVMVDVIEDAPRWLSICFYSAMVTDPDEKGDWVPGGLLGEDAICFDIDEQDAARVKYIEARLEEACQKAMQDG